MKDGKLGAFVFWFLKVCIIGLISIAFLLNISILNEMFFNSNRVLSVCAIIVSIDVSLCIALKKYKRKMFIYLPIIIITMAIIIILPHLIEWRNNRLDDNFIQPPMEDQSDTAQQMEESFRNTAPEGRRFEETDENIPHDGLDYIVDGELEAEENITQERFSGGDPNDPRYYNSPQIYPLIYYEGFQNIEILLRNNYTVSVFDLLSSGLLTWNENNTFYPNPDRMVLREGTVIQGIGLSYTRATTELNSAYNEQRALARDSMNRRGSVLEAELRNLDTLIYNYERFILHRTWMRDWSIENAGGVCMDLMILLARDHMEVARLYARRNEGNDKMLAIDNFIAAIFEYSQVYRMSIRADRAELITDRNILYWIASAYFNLGHVQRDDNDLMYRLGSFTTADLFFEESIHLRLTPFFEAHARYFNAIACHNVISFFMIRREQDNEPLPMELRYYIKEAFMNYSLLRSTPYLGEEMHWTTRDHIIHALNGFGRYVEAYLQDHPEQEAWIMRFFVEF
jgi:hypothetical protein